MDHFRLNKLKEVDIDALITAAGGRRAVDDHSTEKSLNADYLLDEAVIELKLFEEEGLEKQTRQRKIGKLFSKNQSGRPVVVIDPDLLGKQEQRQYYNALEGPMQDSGQKGSEAT